MVRCSAAVLDIMDVLPGSGIWPCPSVLQDTASLMFRIVSHVSSDMMFSHVSPILEFHILFFLGWSF